MRLLWGRSTPIITVNSTDSEPSLLTKQTKSHGCWKDVVLAYSLTVCMLMIPIFGVNGSIWKLFCQYVIICYVWKKRGEERKVDYFFFSPLTDRWNENTFIHYLRKRNHKCFKLKSEGKACWEKVTWSYFHLLAGDDRRRCWKLKYKKCIFFTLKFSFQVLS